MKKEFLKYDWKQLLNEDLFVSWILRKENSNEWEKFIAVHLEIAKEAAKAREILTLLQDKYDVMDEDAVKSIWKNIEEFEQEIHQSNRKLKIRRILGWAASILLILSLGTMGFFYFGGGAEEYQFATTYNPQSGDAHVLLSTGEKIALIEDNSTIQLDHFEQQLIVNDSIIQLERNLQTAKSDAMMNEVVIPFGKQSELTLADGTVIWLNAGSKLAFPSAFTKSKREVYLEGEACFQVAHDEQKPFTVRTGELEIKVHGTLFNVSAYPDQENVETVLINGSVSLSKTGKFKNRSVVLSPNEKAEFNKLGNEILVFEEPDAEKYVAWINGWLEYNRESLNSVLVKLERYYDIKFHLPPEFPADDKISGKLDMTESLENVMKILSDAAHIDFKINGKDVFIKRKGSS